MIKFLIDGIEDPIVRENFQKLEQFLLLSPIIGGEWRLIEETFTVTRQEVKLKHNCNFIPKDTVMLCREGDQNSYFVTNKFDKDYIYIFIDAPCRLRFLIGRVAGSV